MKKRKVIKGMAILKRVAQVGCQEKYNQSFHQSFNSSCKTKLQTREPAPTFHFGVETLNLEKLSVNPRILNGKYI